MATPIAEFTCYSHDGSCDGVLTDFPAATTTFSRRVSSRPPQSTTSPVQVTSRGKQRVSHCFEGRFTVPNNFPKHHTDSSSQHAAEESTDSKSKHHQSSSLRTHSRTNSNPRSHPTTLLDSVSLSNSLSSSSMPTISAPASASVQSTNALPEPDEKPSTNMTPVWVTLGVVFGLALIGGVSLFGNASFCRIAPVTSHNIRLFLASGAKLSSISVR